jgi:muramoyltetrapeptide carboxypeptidase
MLARRYLRFGGTDAERLADLHAIGTGPAGELTLAVRGGYGLGRLLDRIEFGRIAEQASASGTPIVGHSDFTAFQLAYLAKAGGVSFAGPMLLADFGEEHVDSFMWRHFEGILRAPVHDIEVEAPQVAAPATVEGTLWGGNLAMLCTLLGTPYMPNIDGGILFLEDINEPPYRVERMLLQLLHAGVLARQQAIVLGDFSNYRTTDYDNGYNMDAVFDYVREQLRIPVLTGLPFGHCPRKRLAGGRKCAADGTCRRLRAVAVGLSDVVADAVAGGRPGRRHAARDLPDTPTSGKISGYFLISLRRAPMPAASSHLRVPTRHTDIPDKVQTCFLPQTSPCSSAPSRCSRTSRSSSARATATA